MMMIFCIYGSKFFAHLMPAKIFPACVNIYSCQLGCWKCEQQPGLFCIAIIENNHGSLLKIVCAWRDGYVCVCVCVMNVSCRWMLNVAQCLGRWERHCVFLSSGCEIVHVWECLCEYVSV